MDQLDTSDQALIAAMRKRLLQEIEDRQQASHIVNNVYGGGVGDGHAGVMGALGGQDSASGEDPYDYFVDIMRKDLPEKDPDTGKPIGWEKSVHRHRGKKKVMGPYE